MNIKVKNIENEFVKFKKNKKAGFTDYTFYWLIFKLPFTIACCLAVILIVSQGYHLKGASRQIDADVFSNAFLYNRYIMFYDNLIDRTYVGNVNDEIFYYKLSSDERDKINAYLKEAKKDNLKNSFVSYDFANELNSSMNPPERLKSTSATGKAYSVLLLINKEMQKRQDSLAKTISFRSGVNYIVANITLVDYSENVPYYYSLYYNESKFRELSVYTRAKFTEGEGGFKMYKTAYPVLVGKDKRAGFLVTELILPNEAGSGLFG